MNSIPPRSKRSRSSSQYRSRSRLNEHYFTIGAAMLQLLSQYRSRSRLNERKLCTSAKHASGKSQYRSRSRLNEQHWFQWIRFSCEIMLFRSHPCSQHFTPFVHFVRKGNGFCVINQDISHWIPQPTRLIIRALEDIFIFANLCGSNQSSWFCENQPRKHSVKSLTISVSQNTPFKIF